MAEIDVLYEGAPVRRIPSCTDLGVFAFREVFSGEREAPRIEIFIRGFNSSGLPTWISLSRNLFTNDALTICRPGFQFKVTV